MKNQFFSIKTFLLVGLFLGTLIPMFIAGFYTIHMNKIKLYENFSKHRNILTASIATSMENPIYEFSPNSGSLALSTIKEEEFIVGVNVHDHINELEFLNFNIPQRNKGKLYQNRQNVIKDNEIIGQVEVYFSDFKLQEELKNTKNFLIKIFTITFFALLIIMYPLLYIKIFQPLKKLQNQINDLKNNNLEKNHNWNKNDEIGQIGKSFNDARRTILELINKFSSKNKELETLYVTDRLTGLYNRYKTDIIMENEKERADRYGSSFGIILLDVDLFKRVNDTYGHLVGDSVLIEFAKILKKNIRKTDAIGRWGGEEFLIIVPEISLNDLISFAQKIRLKIINHNFTTTGKMSASFGVALYNKNENLDELILNADKALYEAKKEGRDRICTFPPL